MLLLSLVMTVIGGAMIGLLIKLIKKPIKWFFKFLIHCAFGYVFLWIFNFIGAWFNIGLDYTTLNCAVAGICGIPGIAVLAVLKFLAII